MVQVSALSDQITGVKKKAENTVKKNHHYHYVTCTSALHLCVCVCAMSPQTS